MSPRFAVRIEPDPRFPWRGFLGAVASLAMMSVASVAGGAAPETPVPDFNRDIRRVLSENCFQCHGPDSTAKKGGRKVLRLDVAESALVQQGEHPAIVPGHPERSELVRRIGSTDPDDRMPPPESGKTLTQDQVALLTRWIAGGAPYSKHWSYVPPQRPALPAVHRTDWPRNAVDRFILARLEKEGLAPAPEAEPAALIRRASLDLTGLPPTVEEADEFLGDRSPDAYERLVDRLLRKEAYGEHWARLWLDQARYADSSGYADDPARTIWAYRDYVIRSFNANKPFDRFTVEQLAGDLLPDAGDEERIATAFHRNTLTNNEGGTNDEEYRNVAIVDRVNTTLAVWMGTTIACAQCHNHKYDPITQEEYFRLFAILNNTADADRGDESPIHPLFTEEQQRRRTAWETEKAQLETILKTRTPELAAAQGEWERTLAGDPTWEVARAARVTSKAGAVTESVEDGSVRVERSGKTDTYSVDVPGTDGEAFTGVRVEVLPDERPPGRGVGHADGSFVLTRVRASVVPNAPSAPVARYVRIELPGKERILSLAEVQVFQGTNNLARSGEARQSSTAYNGPARLAIDGNTDGEFEKAKSTTHTETTTDPWWELDLGSERQVDRLAVWNRTDAVSDRLKDFRVVLLDEGRKPVWEQTVATVPSPSWEAAPDGSRPISFRLAAADFAAEGFGAGLVLDNPDPAQRGWSVFPRLGEPHALTLVPTAPFQTGTGSHLVLTLEQNSRQDYATLGRLRVLLTRDARIPDFARTPPAVLAALRVEPERRTESQRDEIARHYLTVAPALQPQRERLAALQQSLSGLKPYTTVPVFQELAADQRRKTHVQRRGNFLDLGPEVSPGFPAALNPPSEGSADRLALARWIVDPRNPLTARVTVNRLWESIFGIGLVRTSEEFGSQGDPPSHPELLDWLAVELVESGWDLQHVLRLLVTSATYRQSSRVTPELAAADPDNRLLARGPRFRLSAEMIRDQALAAGGLLSPKRYGPPVKPQQPRLGLSAAFGSGTDWETSMGEDRYRRGIYTTWRRSNPYPSMATFDAPNREVCLVRRERSNTPLQALVTLNDPVYIEAAQALAARMMAAGGTPADQATTGFRICLTRTPTDAELAGLVSLHERVLTRFRKDPSRAASMASTNLADLPAGTDAAERAAWTVVGNVLLNLDETLMKR